MVSSAIYRYFASRDELLTALIIDGYNAIGQAVEDADAKCRRDDYPGRWRAACRAARAWALAHPHEYALIYGSPVPGYQAPPDTIGPAARSAAVFGRLISDAHAAGELAPGEREPGELLPGEREHGEREHSEREHSELVPGERANSCPAPRQPADAERAVRGRRRLRDSVLPGVSDETAVGALTAWAGVFGVISFELFGQFNNVVTDTAAYFDRAVADLGQLIGLAA